MCGASSEQKDMYAKQSAFYDTMTKQYQAVFGKQQAILDNLTAGLKPIFDKGPSQQGFSAGERTDLDTKATELTASGYADAKRALGDEEMARGGSGMLPSGVDAQLSAGLMGTAEAENANLHQNVDMADWETGRSNWAAAAQGLSGVAGQENPVGFADATTGAGSAASKTANDIAAASNSIWGSVLGGLSGIAGSAAEGWAGKQ